MAIRTGIVHDPGIRRFYLPNDLLHHLFHHLLYGILAMRKLIWLMLSSCVVAGVGVSTAPVAGAAPVTAPYVTSRSTQDQVFVSGQIGVDPAADGVAPDFEQQMQVALQRLEAALEAACSSPAEVLRTTVYLADPANMAVMNRQYRAFFESRGAPLPARSLVPGLDFGNAIAVEIDAVAARTNCQPAVRTAYVSITVRGDDDGADRQVAGRFRYPLAADKPVPAVLILHGSAGIDSRGDVHADALNELGIATLELDLWAARGWLAERRGRPAGVPETLPDAFAALDYLAAMPEVDAARIGISGFSWGGAMTVLSATRENQQRYGTSAHRFAAHGAFYPVCWAYDRVPGYELASLGEAPMLILTGDQDDYDTPTSCLELAARYPAGNIDVVVYPDAHHGFNAVGLDTVISDPFSHQGRGGEVRFKANPAARAAAVARLNAFFATHLKP